MPRPIPPRHRRPARAVAQAYALWVDDALYRSLLLGGAITVVGLWLPAAAWLLGR